MDFIVKFWKLLKRGNVLQYIFICVVFMQLASMSLDIPWSEIDYKMPQRETYYISWVWSWNMEILANNPLNLFEANIYAPFSNTLAFSETFLGTTFMAWPILKATGNIALTYNLIIFLSFAISGMGMYALVYYLTKNKWASLLAALVYAFNPFKVAQSAEHLHLVGMWLPFVFLYLHKFFKKQSWKNVLILLFFVILVFLNSMHYFIFLPIVIVFFGVIFISVRAFSFNRGNIIKILLAMLLLVMIVLPLIRPYYQVKNEYGVNTRLIGEVEAHSPDLVDYFIPSPWYEVYSQERGHIEMIVSPGLVIILLFILAMMALYRSEFFREGNNKRNFVIYGAVGLVAFLISFGYYIQLTFVDKSGIPGPYILLYYLLPGFNGIRAAGRYSVFLLLSMAVVIGYGMAWWLKQGKSIFIKLLSVFWVFIFLFTELTFIPTPAYGLIGLTPQERATYSWIKDQPNTMVFWELPMASPYDLFINYDINYVFNSRLHFRKIVNGYSGYCSPGYFELATRFKYFNLDRDISTIREYKTNYMVFHFDYFEKKDEDKDRIIQEIEDSGYLDYAINFGNNYIYQVIYD